MNHLKELRPKKGLTFKELSQELAKNNVKIAPDSLAKYERGERNPKIDKLEALSEFYNVSIPYLQGNEIPMKTIIRELNYCWLDDSSIHGTDQYSSHQIIKMYLELYGIKQQPMAKTKEDFRTDNINYWKKYFSFVFDEIHKKELQGKLYSYQISLIDNVIYDSIVNKINLFAENPKMQLCNSLREYVKEFSNKVDASLQVNNQKELINNIDKMISKLQNVKNELLS